MSHQGVWKKQPRWFWSFLTHALVIFWARSLCSRSPCTTGASAITDTLQWVGAARRGIPFRTAWKRQQLVMQGISRGKACSCQRSLGAGAKLEGRQIIPSSPPASPRCQELRGRRSLQSLSSTPFQLPGRRNLLFLPSDAPRSGRSQGRRAADAVSDSYCH